MKFIAYKPITKKIMMVTRLSTNMVKVLFLGTLSFLIAPHSLATILSISPTNTIVDVGTSIEAEIVISDLGDFTFPSLGAFDIDVSFDDTVLAPTSVVFGDPVLGNQLDLFGFGSINGFNGSAYINLYEVSLDLATDLEDYQSGSFTLATVTFDTLMSGVSALDLTVNALGDAFGSPLNATLVQGSVEVTPHNPPVSSISAPTSIPLFMFGLLYMTHILRRSK